MLSNNKRSTTEPSGTTAPVAVAAGGDDGGGSGGGGSGGGGSSGGGSGGGGSPSRVVEGSFHVDGGGPLERQPTIEPYMYNSSPKRSRSGSLGGPERENAMRKFGMETLEQMTKIQDLKDKFVGEKPLIWVDCDPGGDDCFALMWLFALEQKGHCKVLGISTADGNVSAPLTYAAADKVAHLCLSLIHI